MATTIKLSRVALLVVVIPLCAIVGGRSDEGGLLENPVSKIPYFLPGFILAAVLATWIMPQDYSDTLTILAKISLAPIMASIGFFFSIEGVGNEGRKNILKKFDVEKMCQSTFTEYKKLLKV